METKEIRLTNLLALAAGYKRNSQFCERIGMNPTYFSQVKTGRKSIGDELARRIEQSLGLPRGYLDTPKTDKQRDGNVPIETLSAAYALEALAPAVRDTITRLIYTLAAEAAEQKAFSDKRVAPFTITIGGRESGERDSAVPPQEAAG